MRQHVVDHHALQQCTTHSHTARAVSKECFRPSSFHLLQRSDMLCGCLYLERECLLADGAGESLGVVVHRRHVALHISDTREHATEATSAARHE